MWKQAIWGAAIVALAGISGAMLHHHLSKSCTYFHDANVYTGMGISGLTATVLLTAAWFREFIFR